MQGWTNTYALLNYLNIFMAYAHTPRSSQMPPRFPLQVLDHDTRENDHFRVNIVEDLAVGKVQPVSDVCGDPGLEKQDGQQWFSGLEGNR